MPESGTSFRAGIRHQFVKIIQIIRETDNLASMSDRATGAGFRHQNKDPNLKNWPSVSPLKLKPVSGPKTKAVLLNVFTYFFIGLGCLAVVQLYRVAYTTWQVSAQDKHGGDIHFLVPRERERQYLLEQEAASRRNGSATGASG